MKLLLLGAGYSARVVASLMAHDGAVIYGTTRHENNIESLARLGINPIVFDGLSVSGALDTVLREVTHVLVSLSPVTSAQRSSSGKSYTPMSAPVPEQVPEQAAEPVSADQLIIDRLAMRTAAPVSLIYLSTIGVYGDHKGDWVDEMTPCKPVSQRSVARIAAEQQWLSLAKRETHGHVTHSVGVYRLSGIYGPGRNAFVNLANGRARRIDVPGQYFNRIHVADIATAVSAGFRQRITGVYNITDSEPAPGHEVVAYAAALSGLDCPPLIAFDEADLSPMAKTFYGENKRVRNARSLTIPGMHYRYDNYRAGLSSLYESGTWRST